MEANLYGGAVDVSPDPNAYVAEWEKMPVVEPEALWPTAGDGGYKVQKTEVVENLWGDEDDVVKKQAEILCTVHGIICKKGICKEYAKILREKERAEREAAARTAGGGGKGICSFSCSISIGADDPRAGGRSKANNGNNAGGNKSGGKNNNNNGWKKKGANPWNDDDSGSATGSEGRARSPATAPKNDGWSTVRGR
jgi:hypothetical protein